MIRNCPYGCPRHHGRHAHHLRARWLRFRLDRRFDRKVRSFASLTMDEQLALVTLHGVERVRWYAMITELAGTSPHETNYLRTYRLQPRSKR